MQFKERMSVGQIPPSEYLDAIGRLIGIQLQIVVSYNNACCWYLFKLHFFVLES